MVQTETPVINNLNNGILTGRNAAPQQDSTTDTAVNDRVKYWRTIGNPRSMTAILQNTSHAVHSVNGHQRLAQTGANPIQKKWGNSNRDASQIARNRTMISVGKGMNPDSHTPISYTTTRSVNTERDARQRCRSGGYCVPPKVSKKYLSLPTYNARYQIVALGFETRLSTPSCGLYLTNSQYPNGSLVYPGTISYNLAIIGPDGKLLSTHTYNLFDSATGNANAEAMASALNSVAPSNTIVVFTYDEPQTHSGNSNFVAAMKNCGASSNFPTMINYRGAYLLVGSNGKGVNRGKELYFGGNFGSNGDPNAKVSTTITF